MMSSEHDGTKDDEFAAFSAIAVNGYPYKMVDGDWVPDEAARRNQIAMEAAEQKRKDELVFACRSRVLTNAEMGEIEKMGIDILIRMNGGISQNYKPKELEQRLDELLLQQFKLRRAAEITEASTTEAEGR